MRNLDLRKVSPIPHPTSEIFKRHKIPLSSVAIALNLSYSHTSTILSGIRSATPNIDEKLHQLAESLEKEGSHGMSIVENSLTSVNRFGHGN